MKKIFLLLCLSFSVIVQAEIPMNDLLAPSEFKNMIISPNGKRIAAIHEGDIKDKITILDLKSMKNLITFEFGENRKVSSLSWANNDYVVMNVRKFVGNLDRRGKFDGVYLAKFDGSKRDFIYGAKTGISNGSLYDSLEKEPKHILINSRSGYKKHNIKSGRAKAITAPKARIGYFITGQYLDINQKVRMYGEMNEDLDPAFYYLPEGQTNWVKLAVPGNNDYDLSVDFVGYTQDPNIIYIQHNFDGPVMGLYKFNLNTGKSTKEYKHEYVDILGSISNVDKELVGVSIEPGYREVKWLDDESSFVQMYKSLIASFPGQVVSITSQTNDGKKYIVYVRSDINPGQFYLYNKEQGELKYLSSTFPNIKSKELSKMLPFNFKARDGVELHGYLTLPKGKESKNLPLIVNPHGGPHGPRDRWGYNPEIQLLANRGYAVLQVNFRGSGGYGRKFEESGYEKWGREMQDDVTDATLWAVNQGYADKERLCIYGGSYGGYAAIQGVVREPDLYKCAVGYVGVYDLEQFKTCGDGAGTTMRNNVLARYVGTDKAVQRAYSPAYNVDKIKADLFIAHGKDDVRVPMCQGNALKKALEKAGKDFIWMARDEGHGYQKMDNKRDFYSTMLKFIDKNIGH
jgi:dipeptidyl aminopeptidase/acylaminoacyl peptidase